MKTYPDIYIFGREVNGRYVEYHGSGDCKTLAEAQRVVQHLQKWETSVGTWKILKYGNPRTIKEDMTHGN